MADLTADEVAVIRSWVGEGESLESLQERFTRLDSIDDVIVESIRSQLAKLREQPASLSLPGGLSIGVGDNIRSLEQLLKSFLATGGTDGLPDAGGTASVTRLSRRDMR